MKNNKQEVIRDFFTLANLLGNSYTLFIGSAVPGVNSPKLPMTFEVMEVIFKNFFEILYQGSYDEQIAANYALALNKGGKYNYIVKSTKFEEFLGIIQNIVGRKKLNELIRKLYLCQDGEFGLNQSAISWLLEKQICSLCLTTNFDNSVEIASKNVITLTYLNYFERTNLSIKNPVQLKLHGDVKDDTCVATNRSLFEHVNFGTYDFLKELLKNKKILVLGYSGDGDIDINPHLSQTKADFFWCEVKESNPVQPYSKFKVICDLSSSDPEKNLLIGLAAQSGWKCPSITKNHNWDENLQDWCRSIDNLNIVDIIIRIFFGKPGWPVIHLIQLFSYSLYKDNSDVNIGIACLQKSAYGPAEKIFLKVINSESSNENQLITARLYQGFIHWRKGKFEKAIQTLWWFYNIDPYKLEIEKQIEISDALRTYLEVVRDWMQIKPFVSSRKKIFTKYRVGEIIKKFESMRTYDFKEDILKKIVILHIQYLNGEPINKELIEYSLRLFKDGFNTKNWSTCEATARLLINLSLTKGLKALLIVDYKLIQRRQWNVLRKSLASFLNKITFELFPWLIINLVDGPLLSNLDAPIRDYNYNKKLRTFIKLKNQGKIKIA